MYRRPPSPPCFALLSALVLALRAAATDTPPTAEPGEATTASAPAVEAAASEPGASAPEAGSDAPPAAAPSDAVYGETIEVRDRASDLIGIAGSAGEGVTGRADLAVRPVLRAGELLETVPGLIVTQHSGDGKANQYFLRGFNLDHGTDFAVHLDGVPVNMPTHGHGQGYADVSALIPELIDTVSYRKGPYHAREGDFAAAGAARIAYVDQLDAPIVTVSPGENGYGRGLVAGSTAVGSGTLLGAVELVRNDGPWQLEEDYEKLNAHLRYTRGDAARGFGLALSGYDGSWQSTDQIPLVGVRDGALDRFGFVDPSDGGSADRWAATARAWRAGASAATRFSAYAVRQELALFSNFTYFLDDEENGDQFEQRDERTILGLGVDHRRALAWGDGGELAFGVDARFDRIDDGLYHTRERRRLATTREDAIDLLSGGPWAEVSTRLAPWVRTTVGLRADHWRGDVDSDLAANSGSRSETLLSPKLALVFGPWAKTELYLNAGYGFHSNDARGATIRVDPGSGEAAARVDPLVRAQGVDLGVRSELLPGYNTALTVFGLDIDSELVFIGDAGGTEASRPSRRVGVEWQNHWNPRRWLRLDADLALSRGRFRDDAPEGDHIPGSIERSFVAGVAVDDLGGWSGALRLRYFGPRPLLEDDSVRSEGSTLLTARLGYAFANGLRLGLDVFNLLDEEADDIAYHYESRLAPGAEAVEGVHFHPAEPRTLRLIVGWSR